MGDRASIIQPLHDWAVMPLSADPLFHDPDGYPVPPHVLRALEVVEAADVGYDVLYVAHELPKRTLPEHRAVEIAELLPPPPPRVERTSRALGAAARKLWAAAAAPLGIAGAVGLGLGALVVATGAIAGAGLAVLDPILLGVVVAPGRPMVGEQAAWFLLVSWTYAEEDAPWRS